MIDEETFKRPAEYTINNLIPKCRTARLRVSMDYPEPRLGFRSSPACDPHFQSRYTPMTLLNHRLATEIPGA